MKLYEYLRHHNLSLAQFGDKCGTSASTVMRVRDGTVIPSRKTLRAIVEATDHEVTARDLIDHAFTQPQHTGSRR